VKNKTFLLLATVFLLACNLSTPAPAQEPVVIPDTDIPPPTEAIPASTSTSAPSTDLFRDEFNQVLAGGWSWQNEDAANWNLSVKPGWLEITVQRGHIVTGNYANLLLRSAPVGDFQIETSLDFEPSANFQFAGLIVYESDADFLQAGRAFCEGTDGCIGSGLYLDQYFNNTFQPPNFATPYEGGGLVHLRLQRRDDVYTFFASPDGLNWTEIGQHQSDITPLQVGLMAAQNNDGVPLPARFGYFMISGVE
jgi:beta-xylosidase